MEPQASHPVKTHISLNVSNIERSVTFYEAFFGVAAHKQRPGYANFDLSEPPLKFAMQEQPVQQESGPLSHLGFQVATVEQVQAMRNRLIAAGLATFDEKDATCCYALQERCGCMTRTATPGKCMFCWTICSMMMITNIQRCRLPHLMQRAHPQQSL